MPLSNIITGQLMSFFLVTLLNVICFAIMNFWIKYPTAMVVANICFASVVGIGLAHEIMKEEKEKNNDANS